MPLFLQPLQECPHGRDAVSTSLLHLGVFLESLGQYVRREAEQLLAAAVDERRRAVEVDPHREGLSDLATSLAKLAGVNDSRGDYDAAERLFREALAMRRAAFPTDEFPQGEPSIATVMNDLALTLFHQGRLDEASQLLRDVVAMNRLLHPVSPRRPGTC